MYGALVAEGYVFYSESATATKVLFLLGVPITARPCFAGTTDTEIRKFLAEGVRFSL